MKKIKVVGILVALILLFVINYRTPFLQQNGGLWSIGYGSSQDFPDKISFEDNEIYALEKLQQISDSTEFLTTPFFIKEKEQYYVFFGHKKSKPNYEIGLLVSPDGENYEYIGTVLKEKFDVSYPQIFKFKEDFFMVPDAKYSNNILIYKSYNFPYEWKVYDTLVKNKQLKNPSIYLSDTLNIMVASDDSMNLFMYESNSLFGKWKLHKKSKVLMGTESRAAGRFINSDEGLFLPIQNNTKSYGYGVSLYSFTFNNGDYSIKRSIPLFMKRNSNIAAFNSGMHHIDIQENNDGFYYVYDGDRLKDNSKKLNIWGPIKWNYFDLKNWFVNK